MNNFGHIEIPTTNIKKAKKFFGGVFGWTFTDHPEIDYTLFRAGSRPNGGIELVKKMPKKGQVLVYVEVKDITARLKQIKKAGGGVVQKKTKVEGMGWYAKFSTPDGCVLALWQAASKK